MWTHCLHTLDLQFFALLVWPYRTIYGRIGTVPYTAVLVPYHIRPYWYHTIYGCIDTRPVPLTALAFGLRYRSLLIHTVLQP